MLQHLPLALLAATAQAAPLNFGSFFSSSWGSSSSSQGASAVGSKDADTTSTGTSFYTGNVSSPALFVYNNAASGLPPDPKTLGGYNYYAMTFWMSTGTVLNAATWEATAQADQQTTHQAYKDAGVLLLVSAFGSSETPVTTGADPTTTANNLAAWCKANNVDGVDIDFEDFSAMRNGATGVQWVQTFQTTLRQALGTGYFISHAPIAPWFSTDSSYFAGGYLAIDKAVGSTIDLYLVQFYNQDQYYNTCAEIVTGGGDSEAYWPGSALTEIIASGISANKLLIGKPVTAADATSGYTDLSTLAQCITQAKATGWNAGIMAWAWPDAGTTNFLSTVWGS